MQSRTVAPYTIVQIKGVLIRGAPAQLHDCRKAYRGPPCELSRAQGDFPCGGEPTWHWQCGISAFGRPPKLLVPLLTTFSNVLV
jgi:hypothetical protein